MKIKITISPNLKQSIKANSKNLLTFIQIISTLMLHRHQRGNDKFFSAFFFQKTEGNSHKILQIDSTVLYQFRKITRNFSYFDNKNEGSPG